MLTWRNLTRPESLLSTLNISLKMVRDKKDLFKRWYFGRILHNKDGNNNNCNIDNLKYDLTDERMLLFAVFNTIILIVGAQFYLFSIH